MENKIQLFATTVMLLFTLVIFYVATGLFSRWDTLDDTIRKAELLTASLTVVVEKTERLVPKLGEASEEASKGFVDGIRKSLNKGDE